MAKKAIATTADFNWVLADFNYSFKTSPIWEVLWFDLKRQNLDNWEVYRGKPKTFLIKPDANKKVIDLMCWTTQQDIEMEDRGAKKSSKLFGKENWLIATLQEKWFITTDYSKGM